MDLVSQNLLMTSGGKKDPTYIDDVFSTYLYKGDGQTGRSISNGIKLSNNNAGNSVDFYGSSGQLEVASTSDFAFGTDPFTIEFWLYFQSTTDYCAMFEGRPNSGNGNYLTFGFASGYLSSYSDSAYRTQGSSGTTAPTSGQWTHIALVREGTGTNQEKIYFNGTQVAQGTNPVNIGNQRCLIAGHAWSRGNFDGHISNYRVVKGQAIYTSNFTPSTQALTTTSQGAIASNVKLLCCNKNTVTGSTVTPGTIAVTGGSPTTSGFGPFTATDGEGGMTWIKGRSVGTSHIINDTVRGAGNRISSNSANESASSTAFLSEFNNNGFSIGNDNDVNYNGQTFSSWTWRKQKGFFDIVTYTGDGTDRQIAHSLGSVPGAIFVKRTDQSHNWGVYHRGLNKGVTPEKYRQRLNVAGQEDGNNDNGKSYWNNTAPTSTHFTVSGGAGSNFNTNVSGASYVAYIFAGGASTADTARSVSLSGSSTRLVVGPSSDFSMGTGDFTIECWVKQNNQSDSGVWQISNSTTGFEASGFNSTLSLYDTGHAYGWAVSGTGGNSKNSNIRTCEGAWTHLAYVRSSGVASLYVNGLMSVSGTDTMDYDGTYMGLGGYYSTSYPLTGNISNLRVVKGQALYTSSFTPTYEPLTTTSQGAIASNVKLLCFNNASVTGATVTPGTITAVNNPTASTDNPFDDPAGYKFGEGGDQNLIKCGNFITDSSNGATLDLPWEPQWLLFKQNNANNNWIILDSMRGWTADGVVDMLYPNVANTESSGSGYEKLLGNTIRFQGYGNNYDFMYIAIRRPDGYVGKPVEVGTEVFAMDTGNASTTIPAYDSGFPVDFGLDRQPASSENWYTSTRLMGAKWVKTNANSAETSGASYLWDSNVGYVAGNWASSSYQSWMWKRNAGFDVVTYTGNLVAGRQITHSLNKIPEMLWVKRRNDPSDWIVWHKGLNGGTNSGQYYVALNSSNAESSASYYWNNTTQNSTTFFTLGGNASVNGENDTFIAMLFASVEGISKVGYYDGSSYSQTITTGFQPRFLIIRKSNGAGDWLVIDTTRGWAAGNDAYLMINSNSVQATDTDFGAPTSTGFTLTVGSQWNTSGSKYIYYAHA